MIQQERTGWLVDAVQSEAAADGFWNTTRNWFDQTSGVNDVRPTPNDDVIIGDAVNGTTRVTLNAHAEVKSLISAEDFAITATRSRSMAQDRFSLTAALPSVTHSAN